MRKMKNGEEAGKVQVNIETLKAGEEIIAKQLASLASCFAMISSPAFSVSMLT